MLKYYNALIIEDQRDIASLIETVLTNPKSPVRFHVECVKYFYTAMALIRSGEIEYSVVIYDPGLPDMSGVGGVAEIYKALNKTRLIVMSGDHNEIHRIRDMALESGLEIEDFVEKPIDDIFDFERAVIRAANKYEAHQTAAHRIMVIDTPRVKPRWGWKGWAAIITALGAIITAIATFFEKIGQLWPFKKQ